MARKIAVLSANSNIPKTYVKKSVAALLVRRLLAVWVIENLTIRRLSLRTDQAIKLECPRPKSLRRGPAVYQHHIEPKLYKVNRRQMEELERWYASVSAESL